MFYGKLYEPWLNGNLQRFNQRDPEWSRKKYSSKGSLTHGQAGCLVNTVAAGVASLGYDVNPVTFAKAIDAAGAFTGDLLGHPSKVGVAFPFLKWRYDPFLNGEETSFADYRKRPASLAVLRCALETGIVAVEVDFKPPTPEVDQHFVLAVAYLEDPTGGIDDTLIIMDPWIGGISTTDAYTAPEWKYKSGLSRVQRAVLGLRVWEVL